MQHNVQAIASFIVCMYRELPFGRFAPCMRETIPDKATPIISLYSHVAEPTLDDVLLVLKKGGDRYEY